MNYQLEKAFVVEKGQPLNEYPVIEWDKAHVSTHVQNQLKHIKDMNLDLKDKVTEFKWFGW